MNSPQPSAKDLARQIEPHAARLRAITQPLTGDESLPAVHQLAPVAGEIAVLTGYALNTTGDPLGTGRHNLQVLRDLGTRLAEVADAALRAEPGGGR